MKCTGLIIDNKVILDFFSRKQVRRALGAKPFQGAACPSTFEQRRFFYLNTKAAATDAFRYAARNRN